MDTGELVIVFRCQNGIVLFTVERIKNTDFLQWNCMNDKTIGQQPRTGGGLEQFVRDMATKSVALRGAIQQVIDLPEVG